MFKRLINKLFHRSSAPSVTDDLNAFVATICQDMPYTYELQLSARAFARATGNDAIVQFYVNHPEEFVEAMTAIIESEALPEDTIRFMIMAVGVSMPLRGLAPSTS